MRPTAVPSDEDRAIKDRAIKRKSKSSSKRRRRRRRSSDSSPSDDSRSRRKSSRRDAKRRRRSSSQGGDYKKRKSSKKSSKKKSRKSRRYTSSDSSRSCSTCRGRSSSPGDSLSVRSRSRSRSPVRKSKLRVRGRSSVRDRSRRSRYRSPSCSTCSGGSRSRSCSRSPRKDDSLERKDVSRHTRTKLSDDERIAITGRRKEKKRRVEEAVDARKDSVEDEPYKRRQLASSKANGDSRGLTEDSYSKNNSEVVANRLATGDIDGNDNPGRESGSSRDSKNTGVVTGTGSSEAEDLEMILRQRALENFRKFRCEVFASSTSVEAINSESQKTVNSKHASSLDKHRHPPSEGHSIKVGDTLTSNSHSNVTSILAGERKFGSFSNTQNIQHQLKNVHDNSDKIVSEQLSLPKGSKKPIENKPASSLDYHRHTHGRDQPVMVGIKSVAVPVASSSDGKTATKLADDHKISASSNSRSTQDLGLIKHKPSSQMSGQSSITKDVEGERTVTESKSGSTPRSEANIADMSALGTVTESKGGSTPRLEANIADMSALGTLCPKTESENCKSGEPVDATVSGGQFEQKTFSRTHDGEVVQVSYKVYIPKKSTTLARRRLQR